VELSNEEKQDLAVCMVALTKNDNKSIIVRLGGIFGEAVKVEYLDSNSFKTSRLDEEGVEVEERIVILDEVPSYKRSDLLARVSLNNGDVKTIQMLGEDNTGEISLEMKGATVKVLLQTPREFELSKYMQPPKEADTTDFVLSPMPGTLISYAVEEGEIVQIGQELCVIEAMKMQNIIRSPRAGTIASCRGAVGSSIMADDVIIEFYSDEPPPQ